MLTEPCGLQEKCWQMSALYGRTATPSMLPDQRSTSCAMRPRQHSISAGSRLGCLSQSPANPVPNPAAGSPIPPLQRMIVPPGDLQCRHLMILLQTAAMLLPSNTRMGKGGQGLADTWAGHRRTGVMQQSPTRPQVEKGRALTGLMAKPQRGCAA